jgi:hypothetical protein
MGSDGANHILPLQNFMGSLWEFIVSRTEGHLPTDAGQ